ACHIGTLPLLLLAGDGFRRALAGAGVGVGALAADGQALAVAQAAVAAEVHEPRDVHRDFTAQVALDRVVRVDVFADREHFGIGQLVHPAGRVNLHRFADLARDVRADAVDILEGDGDAFPR